MPPAGTHTEREATARRAQTTVVISQRVKPRREDDFRRWQDGMNRAVASYAGFLGTETVAPSREGGEWTVIYRFDSKPHLEAWLTSSDREDILDRGGDLFDATASHRVLIGEPEEELVTVVVTHPVAPALTNEFLDWQRRVTDAARAFTGFGGAELFPPVPDVQEDWTAVFRFDTDEHLGAWLESPERKRLLDEGARFHEFELHRIAGPFGSWFPFSRDADTESPAQWKTALSVLVGLYPTVVLLTLGISEIWPNGELWETLLVGNILSVSLLTWVVMPLVTRALAFWLEPDPGRANRRLDATGAAASIGFLTLAAILFWVVTTQIWTLP